MAGALAPVAAAAKETAAAALALAHSLGERSVTVWFVTVRIFGPFAFDLPHSSWFRRTPEAVATANQEAFYGRSDHPRQDVLSERLRALVQRWKRCHPGWDRGMMARNAHRTAPPIAIWPDAGPPTTNFAQRWRVARKVTWWPSLTRRAVQPKAEVRSAVNGVPGPRCFRSLLLCRRDHELVGCCHDHENPSRSHMSKAVRSLAVNEE